MLLFQLTKAQLPKDAATGEETGNQPSHRQRKKQEKRKKRRKKPCRCEHLKLKMGSRITADNACSLPGVHLGPTCSLHFPNRALGALRGATGIVATQRHVANRL